MSQSLAWGEIAGEGAETRKRDNCAFERHALTVVVVPSCVIRHCFPYRPQRTMATEWRALAKMSLLVLHVVVGLFISNF